MSKHENIVSMSGQPIFRYIDGEKEWEAPHGNRVLQYCPLYDEEMKLKLNKGSNLLLNKNQTVVDMTSTTDMLLKHDQLGLHLIQREKQMLPKKFC